MNMKLKILTVAAALLCLCMVASACRKEAAGQNESAATTQPQDTTQSPTRGTEPAETTEDTQGDSTQPTIQSGTEVGSGREEGVGEQPKETTPPTTKPEPEGTVPDDTLSMTYQEYMKLSGSQQQELFDQYFSDDPKAFAAWFKKIRQEYEDETPEIIATGPIDIEDYIKPNP